MATDRNLIAGAARLADAESAMSIGLGAGLAKEALRIQQDIVQKTNERRSILRQDMNNAATFIGRMQTLDNVTGQYHDVLTERGIHTRDELNRIAEDTSLSSAQKIAEYSRLTNEYNALASNFTRDQQKLIGLQNSIAQGLTSETLDFSDPDVAIARQLGTGEYEITKDGYNVTYDIDGKKSTVLVKSQELDKYISKYSIKDLEGLTEIKNNFITETANAKGDQEAERLVQEKYRQLLTTDQKLKMLVDLEGNAFANYENDEAIISAFDEYAKKLTEDFGYNPTPEERKDLFAQDLEYTSTKIVDNLIDGNLQDFKNVTSPNGYDINEIVVESPEGLADLKNRGYDVDGYEDQIGRVRIITTVNGKPQINYYNYGDDLIKDLLREKLLTTAEGQEERKQARNQSLLAFNNYKEQQREEYDSTISKIRIELENNENNFNKLNNTQKQIVRLFPNEFPDVKIEEEKTDPTPEQEANTVKETRRLWLASDEGKNARKFAAQFSAYSGTNEKAGKVSFMKVRKEMTLREWAKANPNYPAELYGQEEEFNNALEGIPRQEPKKVNYELQNFLKNDVKMDKFLNFMGDKLNANQISIFRNTGALPEGIELPEKYQFLIK